MPERNGTFHTQHCVLVYWAAKVLKRNLVTTDRLVHIRAFNLLTSEMPLHCGL